MRSFLSRYGFASSLVYECLRIFASENVRNLFSFVWNIQVLFPSGCQYLRAIHLCHLSDPRSGGRIGRNSSHRPSSASSLRTSPYRPVRFFGGRDEGRSRADSSSSGASAYPSPLFHSRTSLTLHPPRKYSPAPPVTDTPPSPPRRRRTDRGRPAPGQTSGGRDPSGSTALFPARWFSWFISRSP